MPWNVIRNSLKETLPASEFSLWIEPIGVRRDDDQGLELTGPDQFFCAWVRRNYLALITERYREQGGAGLEIKLLAAPEPPPPAPARIRATPQRLPNMPATDAFRRALHPRYTFEEFMEGGGNTIARSACQALANGDTSYGNCLFINSGTGLGKSHLTQAVARTIYHSAPATQLHYLTAQQFSAEMVKGIQANAMHDFKQKYLHHCDMLLLEDVHSLAGKIKTQSELNEILDFLIKAGKKVILTSSAAPRQLQGLDSEFASRMGGGLVAAIEAPDLETRINIIGRKAANAALELEPDQVRFMATRLRGDVRKVESAIIGLKARATVTRTQVTMAMIQEVLRTLVEQASTLNPETIRSLVASCFKVSLDDLRSPSRRRAITFPRQVGMFLTRKYTSASLVSIGQIYNRDHSTVLHSIRTITKSMANNASVRGQVELLSQKLEFED